MPLQTGAAAPSAASPRARQDRFKGWAYAYLRPGGGPQALAGVGQLGGSQAAARIAYRLTPGAAAIRLAAATRLTSAIHAPGRELSPGLEVSRGPLRLTVERRIALDRAGRDALAAFLSGGLYREAGGWTIDGYAQAGIVGARRRDLFADGALRLGRRWGGATIGGGVWAAAQPGLARIDAGPRLAVPLGGGFGLAIEQRVRLAGDAAPASGPAVTLGLDF